MNNKNYIKPEITVYTEKDVENIKVFASSAPCNTISGYCNSTGTLGDQCNGINN